MCNLGEVTLFAGIFVQCVGIFTQKTPKWGFSDKLKNPPKIDCNTSHYISILEHNVCISAELLRKRIENETILNFVNYSVLTKKLYCSI